nr:Chain C, ComS [Streptococcus thermophilus LMD-9]5JUB_D Chain D, ComS [Streptococcus thermophilus LMD-9]
LPYFAGCL